MSITPGSSSIGGLRPAKDCATWSDMRARTEKRKDLEPSAERSGGATLSPVNRDDLTEERDWTWLWHDRPQDIAAAMLRLYPDKAKRLARALLGDDRPLVDDERFVRSLDYLRGEGEKVAVQFGRSDPGEVTIYCLGIRYPGEAYHFSVDAWAEVPKSKAYLAKHFAGLRHQLHNVEIDIARYIAEHETSNYTERTMGDATARLEAVAADFGLPVDVAKHVLTAAASELTAREHAAPATVAPRPAAAAVETTTRKRGPRVKPNPALPSEAPEIYRDRKPREELNGRKENIVQFIGRVYEPWREILTRADLRRLDRSADRGIDNWIKDGNQLPQGLVPTEFELNTAKRAATVRGSRLARAGSPTVI